MGLFSNIKLVLAGVVLIAFLALGGAYKLKSYQLEQARQALAQEQANNAALSATVEQGKQNRKAQQGSAAAQQAVAQQAAPIHQAIEDSTPETPLNAKQKAIADCLVALFRGVLKDTNCRPKTDGSVLPKARETITTDGTKDR